MWGAYLQPFSLKRRTSKHFSRRWKASSRSSCHISSFWAALRSTISRWGLCVRDFSSRLSVSLPLTLLRPSPPQPADPLILCQYVWPSLPLSLHFTILSLPPSRCFKARTILPVSPLLPFLTDHLLQLPDEMLLTLARRFMCMFCLSKSTCSKTSIGSIQKNGFSDRKSRFSETATPKRCLKGWIAKPLMRPEPPPTRKNTPFFLESKEGAQITFSAQLKQDCG